MIRFARRLVATFMLVGMLTAIYQPNVGAVEAGPAPAGELVIVDASSENQTDGHISGTLIAYTSQSGGHTEIRYFDTSTGAGGVVPGEGRDRLAGVSGNTIVFIRSYEDRSAILALDVPSQSAVELSHEERSRRGRPEIGSSTVTWEDIGSALDPYASIEIVAHDLASGDTTRLTDDALADTGPDVSPDGSVIVWQKCAISDSDCEIWQATSNGSGWDVTQLTSGHFNDTEPATDGKVVFYQSTRNGETDLYWQPVGGGAEQQLSLPGDQLRPSVSGDVVAFETSVPATESSDIMVYAMHVDTVYPITETPERGEYLADVAVSDNGVATVVYVADDPQDLNVYALRFKVPSVDATPPTLIVPADLAVDATGPDGAVVEYEVTAEDDTDENPVVTCEPQSGDTLAIGTTTVLCTATDNAGNQSTDGFTVTVRGADEQVSNLMNVVQSFGLARGMENSLNVKLDGAAEAIADGDTEAACGKLGAFINHVQAQAGKALTQDEAQQLIASASQIRAVVGC